jgi:hypothetical protein
VLALIYHASGWHGASHKRLPDSNRAEKSDRCNLAREIQYLNDRGGIACV